MTALHERYRPRSFDDVAGQPEAVAAIKAVLARGWGGRAWWITGLSGVGKTTLAKLIAADGAAPLCTEEIAARGLTPKGVWELEQSVAMRTVPIDGRTGRAVIINECHGLRKDTVESLLDVLERIPEHVVWLFTTTKIGQQSFFDDDEAGNAAPLVSRCIEIRLDDGPGVFAKLAQRAKIVAQAAGIDGLPDSVYEAAVRAANGNLRAVLGTVESGQLRAGAIEATKKRLAELPLDGRHGAERSRLQALLAEMGV
jgi:replication-associated recombination protein RarA